MNKSKGKGGRERRMRDGKTGKRKNLFLC